MIQKLLFHFILLTTIVLNLTSCIPEIRLPPVHEPLDSAQWIRCAGEFAERESTAMIDDLTLDGKTMLCQAVVLASDGKTDQAIDLLTKSSIADEADHRADYLAGRILAKVSRYEESLSAFQKAQKRFPQMQVPAERLGRNAIKKDGDEQAKIFLQKAYKRNLCPYGCQGLLAKLYNKTGEDLKSEKMYNIMINENPEESAGYVGKASFRNVQGNYMEESELLTQAINCKTFSELAEKQKAQIHYSHAFSRYNARKYKGAVKSIDRALKIEQQADWWVLAGWIQLKLKNPTMALTKFDKAVAQKEILAAAHVGRGDAMMELRRPSDAILSYEQAKKLNPIDAVIVLKLAYAKASAGDKVAAKALLDEAIRIDKEHLPPVLLGKVTSLL